MAVEFYKLKDHKKSSLLFQYTIKDLESLDKVWKAFETKTGVFVDFYGTTRLYPKQLLLLVEILKESNFNLATTNKLIKDIEKVIENGEGLVLEGD